jgi:hypothetical protein
MFQFPAPPILFCSAVLLDSLLSNAHAQIPAPPVTSSVCPFTKDASGEARLHFMSNSQCVLIIMREKRKNKRRLREEGGRKGVRKQGRKKKKREKTTHKSIPAAASSGVPPLRSGMPGRSAGASVGAAGFAPGIPSATVFPSIWIVAPDSLAAVSLCVC